VGAPPAAQRRGGVGVPPACGGELGDQGQPDEISARAARQAAPSAVESVPI